MGLFFVFRAGLGGASDLGPKKKASYNILQLFLLGAWGSRISRAPDLVSLFLLYLNHTVIIRF